jgi:hypothetical protein
MTTTPSNNRLKLPTRGRSGAAFARCSLAGTLSRIPD